MKTLKQIGHKRKRCEDLNGFFNKKRKYNCCMHPVEMVVCMTCKQQYCQLCFSSCYYCLFNEDVNFDMVLNRNDVVCPTCPTILPDEIKYYCETCRRYFCEKCIGEYQGCPWDFRGHKEKIACVKLDDKTIYGKLDGRYFIEKEHSLIQIKLLKCNNR